MTVQTKVEAATLHSAMAAAFAEIEGATKAAVNPHFGKKYADLGAVLAAIKPPLIKHGLFFTQRTQPSPDGILIETVLHHSSGEEMPLGSLYLPADKRDAQKFGSALSYARRYSLLTAFGVPTEDDDGNAAVKAGPSKAAETPMATDEQCDFMLTLAPGAGKTIQGIVEAHKVSSLPELTEAQAAKVIAKLKELAREPANA